MYQKGFTLIQLIILIIIIAVLITVIFIVLDPFTRFKDSRDSDRWRDVTYILDAIKEDQANNNGSYSSSIFDMNVGEVYMVTKGVHVSGCNVQNANCHINITDSDNCVNLEELITKEYLEEVPISPNGQGIWSSSASGYTLQRNSNGIIIVRACESENADEIWIAR